MSLYLTQIEQLIELQKVDDAIHLVKQQLKKAPEEIENLASVFKKYDVQKKHIEEKLQHLNDQEKRLNNELEDGSSSIKKSKAKLMQVENTREYHAMSREMDNMERQNRSREDEQLALKEELEFQTSALAETTILWTEAQSKLQESENALAEKIKTGEKELQHLDETRKNAGDQVPAPVLVRYEFIRKRLEHPVIVSVRNGVCTGCHIAIPPQAYNELQRGQQIVACPNCQRLVYWYDHFHKDEPEVIAEPVEAIEAIDSIESDEFSEKE